MGMIRIAIRQEGNFINAYLAQPGSLEGGVLLGAISVGLCNADEKNETFQLFKQAVEAGAAALLKQLGVSVVGMETREAAEHEKAGHA